MITNNFENKVFEFFIGEKTKNKIEKSTLYISIVGFLIHLLLIYLYKSNLLNIEDCEKIINEINDGDSILFVAGRVPVKNLEMFIQNIQICKNICYILEKKQINHITYLSSDAVYKDSNTKIDELFSCSFNCSSI